MGAAALSLQLGERMSSKRGLEVDHIGGEGRAEERASLASERQRLQDRRDQVHAAVGALCSTLERVEDRKRVLRSQQMGLVSEALQAAHQANAERGGLQRHQRSTSPHKQESGSSSPALPAVPQQQTKLSLRQLRDWLSALHTPQEQERGRDELWHSLVRRLRHRLDFQRREGEAWRAAVAAAQVQQAATPRRAMPTLQQSQAQARVERQTRQLFKQTDACAAEGLRSLAAWASWVANTEALLLTTAASVASEHAVVPVELPGVRSWSSPQAAPAVTGAQQMRTMFAELLRTITDTSNFATSETRQSRA